MHINSWGKSGFKNKFYPWIRFNILSEKMNCKLREKVNYLLWGLLCSMSKTAITKPIVKIETMAQTGSSQVQVFKLLYLHIAYWVAHLQSPVVYKVLVLSSILMCSNEIFFLQIAVFGPLQIYFS